jgi:hypothetical protein
MKVSAKTKALQMALEGMGTGVRPAKGPAKAVEITPPKPTASRVRSTTQTPSEKRLFTEISELRQQVQAITDEQQTAGKLYKVLYKQFIETDSTQHDLIEKVNDLRQQLKTSPTLPTVKKPQDYVLTDADWQRVIAEGYLVEVWDTYNHAIVQLSKLEGPTADRRFGFNALTDDKRMVWFPHCKPLNKPGVLQPYFGQGMPVSAGTRVLVKRADGMYAIGKAVDYDWLALKSHSVGNIVSFMILE